MSDETEREETSGEFLARLGTDGQKWAVEFRKIAIGLGHSDMDEGWLTGWFANAIEAGRDAALRARPAVQSEPDREEVEYLIWLGNDTDTPAFRQVWESNKILFQSTSEGRGRKAAADHIAALYRRPAVAATEERVRERKRKLDPTFDCLCTTVRNMREGTTRREHNPHCPVHDTSQEGASNADV